MIFNGKSHPRVRVFLNNYANYPVEPNRFDDVTEEFFINQGAWRYDNVDDAYAGAIVDLFFGAQHDDPEILIGCDGQNRFLLPDTYQSKSWAGSPPLLETAGADFLMASGLVGLLPPELAVYLCPDWLPALPELAAMLEQVTVTERAPGNNLVGQQSKMDLVLTPVNWSSSATR